MLIADDADAGTRLDSVLARRLPELSRAQAQRLIEQGAVSVNGAPPKASYKCVAGDRIEVEIPEVQPSHIAPQDIALDIVFEDADLLVLKKPRGMVVHPAPGASDGTLVNALLAHCTDLSGIGGVERPGIVHRLDRDTTGLLMVAKTDAAHRALQGQIQSRTARRRYTALVWGQPNFDEAIVDAPIGRHPGDRKKQAVVPLERDASSRPAVTEVKVVERLGPIARVECTLQTGRTHQIRVHCQFAGYPVVGDPIYGGERKSGDPGLDRKIAALGGQALHAHSLAFAHPRTGEPLEFTAPLPDDFAALLDTLRKHAAGVSRSASAR